MDCKPAYSSLVSVLLSVCCLVAMPAEAKTPVETDEGVKAQPFMTLQHSGYFRFRADMFMNGHLGNGVSGLVAPVHQTETNAALGEDSDTLAGANMRFRWQPQLNIGQRLKIGLTLDVLDNVVLGSTADYGAARADVPLVFLSDSQVSAGDTIRVKEVWAQWNFLNAMLFRGGRMADHFGLGMVHNGGKCIDCDFGDYADRVSVLMKAFGFHAHFFLDSPGEGASFALDGQTFGQPLDGNNMDDVIRWGFDLGYTPVTREAKEARRKALGSGKVVFDAVLRNSFTSQNLTSSVPTEQAECSAEDAANPSYDCVELRKRDADLWVPDFWMRLQWRPNFDTFFRMELEVAGLIGDVGFVQNRPVEGFVDSSKEFLSMGAVLQLELTRKKLSYGLEFGIATGDDVAFGPFGQGFTGATDGEYSNDDRLVNNKDVTAFLFDRDYHVDLLMYREVIGTVTNSFYLKPTVRAHLLETGEDIIGGELSVIYGHALLAESVPGREAPLGLETDVTVFYEAVGVGRAELSGGLLLPLSGLNDGLNGPAPSLAFALQARIAMTF